VIASRTMVRIGVGRQYYEVFDLLSATCKLLEDTKSFDADHTHDVALAHADHDDRLRKNETASG
jgi:hypothetical protein